MRMPKLVKVGPHIYTVVRRTTNGDHGVCDPATLQIGVKKGLKLSKAQETLLHEVVHSCVPAALEEGLHSEEAFVTGITPSLLAIIQENDTLIEYLRLK
jgi:hypothetical protein